MADMRNVLHLVLCRKFLGDHTPRLAIGRHDTPAPNRAAARKVNRRYVRRLRKAARLAECGDVRANQMIALAGRLAGCRISAPCGSAACTVCSRAVQRWLAWTGLTGLQKLNAPLGIVSIVPSVALAINGDDNTGEIKRLLERLDDALTEAGLRYLVGGLDFSVNEHQNGDFEPFLAPHFWLIGRYRDLANARAVLAAAFPASETTRTPVYLRRYNGDPKGLAYALKWSFPRRVTLPAQYSRTGETVQRQNTRNRFLRVEQEVSLLLTLDDVGLHRRLISLGFQIELNKKGRPVLRPERRGAAHVKDRHDSLIRPKSASQVSNARSIRFAVSPKRGKSH